MITPDYLKQLFPREGDIPSEYRQLDPVHQRTYLVGGELRAWNGDCKTVLSPVMCTRPTARCAGGDRQLPRHGGEAESEAALDAAVAAYDNGRGGWPTMAVAERIACMQDFAKQMVARRREVVRLIMWEIGKSLADSREGVRPHGRVHPGHDRRAEGAGQQQLAFHDRRGHDRPDPPHAARAWCCAWGRTTTRSTRPSRR